MRIFVLLVSADLLILGLIFIFELNRVYVCSRLQQSLFLIFGLLFPARCLSFYLPRAQYIVFHMRCMFYRAFVRSFPCDAEVLLIELLVEPPEPSSEKHEEA